MAKIHITYNGQSKVIRRLCELINKCAELGTDHDQAFYGDLGETAYEHSQLKSGNPHHVTAADLGLGNINERILAIMNAIGMSRLWLTHSGELVVDHDSVPIMFHGVLAENTQYLLYH